MLFEYDFDGLSSPIYSLLTATKAFANFLRKNSLSDSRIFDIWSVILDQLWAHKLALTLIGIRRLLFDFYLVSSKWRFFLKGWRSLQLFKWLDQNLRRRNTNRFVSIWWRVTISLTILEFKLHFLDLTKRSKDLGVWLYITPFVLLFYFLLYIKLHHVPCVLFISILFCVHIHTIFRVNVYTLFRWQLPAPSTLSFTYFLSAFWFCFLRTLYARGFIGKPRYIVVRRNEMLLCGLLAVCLFTPLKLYCLPKILLLDIFVKNCLLIWII